MIFVGDDWAEAHHDVCLMDESGTRLAARRLPEGLAGVAVLHEMVAEHTSDAGEVVVGIETDRGLWVAALVAAGYQVYAINPMAVSRYRDRHRVGGAKSDRGDAKVLADLVRTDRHNHRPVAGDSPGAEGIKITARAHQNLIWARVRHTNQVRNALREYYPAALETFGDLADRDTLAVLGRAPTPSTGARLTITQIRAALKTAGRRRNLDTTARRIQAGLRGAHLSAAGPVEDAYGTTVASLVRIIAETNRQITELEAALHTRLGSTPTPSSTSPSQDSVLCSAPGRLVSSGTTPTVTPAPSHAETTPARRPSPSRRDANTPSLHVMFVTGVSTTPSTNGRSVP